LELAEHPDPPPAEQTADRVDRRIAGTGDRVDQVEARQVLGWRVAVTHDAEHLVGVPADDRPLPIDFLEMLRPPVVSRDVPIYRLHYDLPVQTRRLDGLGRRHRLTLDMRPQTVPGSPSHVSHPVRLRYACWH